ncbi:MULTISPECIES: LysR family transcriptional regulator [unclassified Pseudomonas]|uniref:LysR family transcriptional regulator n=1 Tax=unclassified Pseudomonas TaxID=196821 RepID=UPI000D35C2FA|nr:MULTISPECIES: LysR family transcriptional regulator [unclassified Pseudomonas]RAU47452.1 LysR family transcriptional regulator [Pseudomonas sp. RIT 409]RAU51873.1 LysR family transcriptional regulator [Pseudomonas sp. RIT 412]
MSIHFDLNDLVAFRGVVEQGSFRRAADSIGITQSALSRRVEKLESALGVKLFERTTRKVSLTNVGRAFLPQVERLLDDLDLALLSVGEGAALRTGTLTIACVPSAAYYFMPHAIRSFNAQYPKIKLKLIDASANEVSAAVTSGEADLGVSFTGNLAPEVEFDLLMEERYVIACRNDHPLAGRTSVTWAEAYQHDYITLDRSSGNRLVMDRALPGLRAAKESICEARHVTTVLGLVEAGLGVAAVPSIAMPVSPHPILASVALTEPEVVRQMGLLKRRGRTLTPAALELERLIRELPERLARH